MDLKKNTHYKGEWWLPNSEIKTEGSLILKDSNDAILKLSGPLKAIPLDNDEPIIIWGLIEDEIPITLISQDSISLDFVIFMDFVESVELNIKIVFSGFHFLNLKEIQTNEALFRIRNTENWARKDNLKFILEKQKQPPYIPFELDSIDGKIVFDYPLQEFNTKNTNLKKEEFCYIRLSYKSPQTYLQIINKIEHFAHFISLVTYSASYPISVQLKVETDSTVNLYYKSNSLDQKNVAAKPVLVPFRKIESNLSSILQKWFVFFEKEKFLTYILIIHIRDKHIFLEDAFMGVVSSLEAYHRKYVSEKKELSEKRKSLIEKVKNLEDLNSKERKKIIAALKKSGSNYSLKERLDELIKHLPILDFSTIDTHKCVDTRNYIAHIDKTNKIVFQSHEFTKVSSILGLLLATCILREIGIDISTYTDHLRHKLITL